VINSGEEAGWFYRVNVNRFVYNWTAYRPGTQFGYSADSVSHQGCTSRTKRSPRPLHLPYPGIDCEIKSTVFNMAAYDRGLLETEKLIVTALRMHQLVGERRQDCP
jgi:hypothetical protein